MLPRATRQCAAPRLWSRCLATSTCLTGRDAPPCTTRPSVDMWRWVSCQHTDRHTHIPVSTWFIWVCVIRWWSCCCLEEPTSMHSTRRTGGPSTGQPTWVRLLWCSALSSKFIPLFKQDRETIKTYVDVIYIALFPKTLEAKKERNQKKCIDENMYSNWGGDPLPGCRAINQILYIQNKQKNKMTK